MSTPSSLRTSLRRTSESIAVPPRSRAAPNYINRKGLEDCLRDAIRDHAPRNHALSILDLACGQRIYEPYFGDLVGQYIGVDLAGNARADVYSLAERLSFRDKTFDVILCTQVLEHVTEPADVIREISRVLKPGGVLFLSTHGSMVFHPTPEDHWRWTQTGLQRVLSNENRLEVLAIRPVAGTFASLAFLNAWYVDVLFRKIESRAGFFTFVPRLLRRSTVTLFNTAGPLLDRLLPEFSRIERPNTLFVNFLAVCRRPHLVESTLHRDR